MIISFSDIIFFVKDLENAIELLVDDKTCVLVKETSVLLSTEKGIAPMINYLNNGIDMKDYSVADKIVGKAAAYLFICAGVKDVYGEVMSTKAMSIFEEYKIPYKYKTKTEKIINRKGDDICPMEKAVQDIDDPVDAYIILKQKVS